jgi:hypothetical protein
MEVRRVLHFVKMYNRPPMLGRSIEQAPEQRPICNNCPLRIGNVACAEENFVEEPVQIDNSGVKGWFKTSHDVPICKHPERSQPMGGESE